jgi:ComF family protein
MKEAIHALKYDRLHPAARRMGAMLAEAIARLAQDAPAEMLVVPVPLHRSRYALRGFNQSRLLASFAIEVLRKTHPDWRLKLAPKTLKRLRATESQAGLTHRQRRLNMRGAFAVSDGTSIAQKHILVVDDILTTGATARAAAQALMKAGAASVWVATLARAVRSSADGGNFHQVFNDATAGDRPSSVLHSANDSISHGVSLSGQPSF